MAAKPPVLKPASNAFDFRIYHIDEAGTPDRVYHPHDPIATCIIKATNITRAMLKETTVRKSFEELARGYCKLRPNAWFLDGVRDAKAIEKILKKCTEDYLGSLETGWPAIVVPEKLKNPNCTAFSVRHAWHVKFEISEQILGLNAWVSVRTELYSTSHVLQQADHTVETQSYAGHSNCRTIKFGI